MTLIYKSRIENLEKVLEKINPKLKNLWNQPDALVPSWATNGIVYNTFPRTENMDRDGFAQYWVEMSDVISNLDKMIKEYYDQLKLDTSKEPYIDQIWIHCHKFGADGIAHNHPDMVISGGIYFQCELNQGNLKIEDIEYPVQTGDVLFWPADVMHEVLPNKLDKDRIAAAIMVKVRPKCP